MYSTDSEPCVLYTRFILLYNHCTDSYIAYKLQISAMFLSDNKYVFLTIFVAQQYPINWIIETFFIQLT